MNSPPSSRRNFRLLTITLQACQPPVDLSRLAAQSGLEWIGHATDCDDGLRQALMTYPDIIVLPWMESTMKLFHALVSLRGECFAPLVVVVVPEAPFEDFSPREGVAVLKVEQLYQNGLAALLQSLLADCPSKKNKNDDLSKIFPKKFQHAPYLSTESKYLKRGEGGN